MGLFSKFKSDTSNGAPSGSSKRVFEPFVFESNQHMRYENGQRVMGLQICPRTISVEKNINGCSGYDLVPGEGYIVRGMNGDTGRPQFSPKPMLIVKSTENVVELKGYPVRAMTPFGYMEVDQSDYGLSVYYSGNKVDSCVLHMFDRHIDLEYMNK